MGIAAFDKAGLVPVAYAKVGVTGSVTSNSGLTVTKLGTGVYKVALPTGMAMDSDSSFVMIQCWHYQLMNSVQQPASSYYLVQFVDHNNAAADCDFDFVLFATILPPVTP